MLSVPPTIMPPTIMPPNLSIFQSRPPPKKENEFWFGNVLMFCLLLHIWKQLNNFYTTLARLHLEGCQSLYTTVAFPSFGSHQAFDFSCRAADVPECLWAWNQNYKWYLNNKPFQLKRTSVSGLVMYINASGCHANIYKKKIDTRYRQT